MTTSKVNLCENPPKKYGPKSTMAQVSKILFVKRTDLSIGKKKCQRAIIYEIIISSCRMSIIIVVCDSSTEFLVHWIGYEFDNTCDSHP